MPSGSVSANSCMCFFVYANYAVDSHVCVLFSVFVCSGASVWRSSWMTWQNFTRMRSLTSNRSWLAWRRRLPISHMNEPETFRFVYYVHKRCINKVLLAVVSFQNALFQMSTVILLWCFPQWGVYFKMSLAAINLGSLAPVSKSHVLNLSLQLLT